MKRNAYSREDETKTADGGSIQHYPKFDLGYAFDDRRWPAEVTVYEHGPGISARWITVGVDNAVPLEECR